MSSLDFRAAARRVAELWAEWAFGPKAEHLEGLDLPHVTAMQIEAFKERLADNLADTYGKGRTYNQVQTMGGAPTVLLSAACRAARIDPLYMPPDSYTFIDQANQVHGRRGLEGKQF